MRKTIIISIGVLFLALFCINYLQNAAVNKTIPLTEDNIKSISFEQEIEKIKKAFNLMDIAKIESFEIGYKRDGTITRLNLQLVSQTSNKYYLYDANYFSDSGKYKVRYSKSDTCPQYPRLYDENQFTGYMKNVNFDKFKPKVDSREYNTYSMKYMNHTTNFAYSSSFDIYIVNNNNIIKFTDMNSSVQGFALWVFGNKIINYKDHVSEESQSSNVYLFS